MKKSKILFIIISAVLLLVVTFLILQIKKYDINAEIANYNLKNYEIESAYLEYLKNYIQPIKLRSYIDNDFVPTSLLGDNDTGKEVVELMKFTGYKLLFTSMFDQERVSFDDCPVTDKFKQKFSMNLLKYFNLIESNDCKSMCSLNIEDKEVKVEVYGNFKNTEPTYWITHHFHYALDEEGNIDDIIFDYTE